MAQSCHNKGYYVWARASFSPAAVIFQRVRRLLGCRASAGRDGPQAHGARSAEGGVDRRALMRRRHRQDAGPPVAPGSCGRAINGEPWETKIEPGHRLGGSVQRARRFDQTIMSRVSGPASEPEGEPDERTRLTTVRRFVQVGETTTQGRRDLSLPTGSERRAKRGASPHPFAVGWPSPARLASSPPARVVGPSHRGSWCSGGGSITPSRT